MLGKLAAGDEVVTAGGILGRIVEVGDQFLTLEIADNVRIKVQRFQVTSLVPKGTIKGA
jgi:preprotein translocase subunit YajC